MSSPFFARPSHRTPRASRLARLLVVTAGLVSGGLATGGCPGSLDNPEQFQGGGGPGGSSSCPDIEADLFPQKCASGSNCHSSDFEAAGLDLESPGIADRVTSQVPKDGGGCEMLPMVDPDNPTESALYDVLLPDSCSSFGQMPFGEDPLTQTEIDCVEEWIAGLEGGGTTTTSGMGGGGMGGMGGAGGMGMGGAGGM